MLFPIVPFVLAFAIVTVVMGVVVGKIRARERTAMESVRCGFAADLTRVTRPFGLLCLRPGVALEVYSLVDTIRFASIAHISIISWHGRQMVRVKGTDSVGRDREVKIVAHDDVRSALAKWFPAQWTE